MKIKSPNDYTKKIIEIFKENKLYELGVKDCLKKGDISCILVIYNIYNKYIIIL